MGSGLSENKFVMAAAYKEFNILQVIYQLKVIGSGGCLVRIVSFSQYMHQQEQSCDSGSYKSEASSQFKILKHILLWCVKSI